MSLLRRIEKAMDHRLRGLFAGGGDEPEAREAIELYRDAIDQIAARVTSGKRGEKVFAFNRVTIELKAESAERRAVLETLFDAKQMGEDIQSTLSEERVAPPSDLTVFVHYPPDAQTELKVTCERADAPVPAAVVKEAIALKPGILQAILGTPSEPEYALTQPLVNLGREQEVVDTQGRVMRRNDLWFSDRTHQANTSVSRSHAHIKFDTSTGDWRIFDDGSSLGTSLFREGKRIDIPQHGARGVALKPGDEINLGQVRLRFGLTK